MSNLEDVKPRKTKLNLGGEEVELIFDFNAFALIEDKYENIDAVFEAIDSGSIKKLRDLIWAGTSHRYLDEETEKMSITPVGIGKLLRLDNIQGIQQALVDAIKTSMPEAEEVVDREVDEIVKKQD